MDDIRYLEEPPPIDRVVAQVEPRRKSGLLAAWSRRESVPAAGSDVVAAARPRSSRGLVLGLLLLLGVQGLLYFGVRRDLAELRTRTEQANMSIGQIWESAKGLDQDRMGRLGQLADSIRLVSGYVLDQVRQWETNYAYLLERQDENNSAVSTRLDGIARAEQTQRSRLDALERQDRTHSIAFEALARRAAIQETTTRDVNGTVAALRGTLGRMDAALSTLEQRYAASNSAYGLLDRRMESLSGWADGFRRAGLSGDAVQGQFTALSNELRRIRMRVDSLRPMGRAVSSLDGR